MGPAPLNAPTGGRWIGGGAAARVLFVGLMLLLDLELFSEKPRGAGAGLGSWYGPGEGADRSPGCRNGLGAGPGLGPPLGPRGSRPDPVPGR